MVDYDDHDFKKAKKALMVSTSILFVIAFAIGNIDSVNFAIIKFQNVNEKVIIWFLIVSSIYHMVVFTLRHSRDSNEKRIRKNNDLLDVLNRSSDDFRRNIEKLELNIEKLEKKLNQSMAENSISNKEYEKWGGLNSIKSTKTINKDIRGSLYAMVENIRVDKKKVSIIKDILDGDHNLSRTYNLENIFDFWLPLAYGVITTLLVLKLLI